MIQTQRNFKSEVYSEDQQDNTQPLRLPLTTIHQNKYHQSKSKAYLKKVYVGTGFTFNLSDFFQFPESREAKGFKNILKDISGSPISWLVLIYSLINSACFPAWILSLETNKFVALTWRFLFQSFIMIPFVLHEKRTYSLSLNSTPYPSKISDILSFPNLSKIYIKSALSVTWYGIVLTVGQFTHIAHALYFGSLANFFLSITRKRNISINKMELIGQIVILIGISTAIYGSLNEGNLNTGNNVLKIMANLAVLATSYFISNFHQSSQVQYPYPPYLSLCLSDMLSSINFMMLAYFFNGATFDTSPKWGFFSFFLDYQAALFIYTLIILCVGIVVTYSLISKMFRSSTMPAILFFLEPGIAIFMMKIFNTVGDISGWSLIGFGVMILGMPLILMGHQIFEREEHEQRKQKWRNPLELKQMGSVTIQHKQKDQNLQQPSD